MSLRLEDIRYGEVNITDQEFYEYIEDKSLNDPGKYCIFTMYPDKYRTDKIQAYDTAPAVRGTRSQFVYVMADAIKGNTDDINEILSGVVAVAGFGDPLGLQIIVNRGR
jgi:hypothetical protein